MKEIIIILIILTNSLKLYSQNNAPTYYLDSVECADIPLFNPDLIADIKIGQKAGTNGQIFINIKKGYKFNWIYFSTIATNYSTAKTTLFMLNNEFVKAGNANKIDSSFILKIEKIDTKDLFMIGKNRKKMIILNILTNTKANVEKSKMIRIRGTNELTENTN